MKKTLVFALIIVLLFSSISFANDLVPTITYLKSQDLDEWGILALYASEQKLNNCSLDKINSDITTDYEAYIVGAVALEKDVAREKNIVKNSQRDDGKFADYIDGTGEELVNAHIWGIISLYVAGENSYDKEGALDWLKENQNSDGGFPIFVGDNNSNVDLTAMGVVAYKALGLDKDSGEVKSALKYIDDNLYTKESCESIAWAILSKISVKANVDKKMYNKLLEYRLNDGGFKHINTISKSNYMATWHGLLAMVDYKNKISIFDKLHNLNKFKDLKRGNYAYEEIMALVGKGAISGYSDDTFKPHNPVKRSEFVKILIYALNMEKETSSYSSDFKDLKNHWADKVVKLAVQKGFIKGVGNRKFAPDNNITGAEVIAVVIRAKGLEEKAKSINGSSWYEGYVKIAKEEGLLYKNFAPNKYTTRAQCAEIVYKLIK
ncbi:S-layer homology domain-containing protein [Brassicibacter mesophilus]|uniref:S-layer homology domain-containing protein n=1 Tax=Brassicibacter mesophilus TaxID=745119 RepID=UPI003D1B1541